MKKNISFGVSKALLSAVLVLGSFLLNNTATAQLINESFEEAEFTNMTTNTGSAIVITATSAASTLSYYSSSSSTASTTNTSPNSGTWIYSKGSWSSDTKLNKIRSISHSWGIGSSSGYLITPVIANGVATISFWAAPANNFIVGINTNTSATDPNYAAPVYSSTMSSDPVGYTYLSQSYAGSGTAGNTSMQQFSFTVGGGSFTGPCRVGFFNASSSTIYLDDIVITSGAVVAPTVPTTQTTAISFSSFTTTSMTVSWTNGNGANRAVFVKDAAGAITNPAAGTVYTASNDWNSGSPTGTQLGTSGYYCVYNGSGSSVSLTNLQSGHTYFVQSFEYNGTGAGTLYNVTTATGNPNSQLLSASLAPAATTNAATVITTTGVTLNGTINANGASTTVVFNYGPTVTYGTNPAATPSPVTGTTNTAVTAAVTGLTANTLYHFRVSGTNTTGTTNGSDLTFTTLPNAPTIAAGSAATSAGFTANWTAPAGGSATFTYTLVYGTDPLLVSGNTTVNSIASTNLSYGVTGLLPATTYYYKVQAVNATGAGAFSAISTGISTLAATAGTLTATGTLTNFGNVVVGQVSASQSYSLAGTGLNGTAITVTAPTGFQVCLTAGGTYTSSVSITTANPNYTGTTLTATNIFVKFAPTTVGATGNLNVQNAGGSAPNVNVQVAGTGIGVDAATGVTVAHKSDNIMHITWTAPATTVDGVLVFARPVGAVNYAPTGAGSSFTNANLNIATAGVYNVDNLLVYSGTGTSIEVTGLANNTAYHFTVVAYVGSAYATAATANATTGLDNVTAVGATVANAQTTISWTNPAFFTTQSNYWDEVLLVGSAGAAVSQTPTGNGSGYTDNLVFGSGTDLGTSNYAVYKGSTSPQTITNIANGTVHHFTAFVRHGTVWSSGSSVSVTPDGLDVPNVPGASSVTVYPNPASDMLFINAPVTVNVVIKDLTGRVVLTGKATKSVELQSISEGIYLVTITDEKGAILKNEKLVKAK